MNLANFSWDRLSSAGPADPLRVLSSACLAGRPTGWDGSEWPHALTTRLLALPSVCALPFCPEELFLGTPRPLTSIYDGDGRDVLAGRARVLDTTGRDCTAQLIAGARRMAAHAVERRAELAILLDVSDSCGTNVVYDGDPAQRRYRRGLGVAAAALQEAGVPTIAQRDEATLGRIVAALDPSFAPDEAAIDFADHPWYREYFRSE